MKRYVFLSIFLVVSLYLVFTMGAMSSSVFLGRAVYFEALSIFLVMSLTWEVILRKHETILQHSQRLEILSRTISCLFEEYDLQTLYKKIVDSSSTLFKTRYSAFALMDEAGKITTFVTHGFKPDEKGQKNFFPDERVLLRAVEQGNKILRLEDLTEALRFNDFPPHKRGMSSFLGAPITLGGKVYGVLYLMEKWGQDLFSREDEAFMVILAGFIARAIENAQLFSIVEKAKAEWENTFDTIADPIFITDASSIISRANKAVAERLGMPFSEFLGKKCCQVIWGMEELPPHCPQVKCLKTKKPLTEHDIEIPAFQGTFTLSAYPIFDEKGEVTFLICVYRDVTKVIQLRQQLIQSEKLATVGQLASGVAHELSNPLTSVLGFSQMLTERTELEEEVKKDIDIIHTQAQRTKRIVDGLLTFSRAQKPERKYVDIQHILDQTLILLEHDIRQNNIQLQQHYSESLPMTMADPYQLQQAFLNILTNALYAMKIKKEGERVLILRIEEALDTLSISITDTGVGISEEHLDKIFDPFFTTKPVGKGTGLGLSIVYGIIQEHGGTIRAHSKKGQGTRFIITLPVLKEEKVPGKEAPLEPPEARHLHKGKTLVVEDEAFILELVTRVLEEAGHTVMSTDRSMEALKLIEKEAFDFVLLDIKMPDMSGIELYEQLEQRLPALKDKVIFMTGDTSSPQTWQFLERTKRPTLLKPFSIEKLLSMVSQEEVSDEKQNSGG